MGLFKNWNTWKGVSKFLLGAVGVIAGIAAGNAQPIIDLIGQNSVIAPIVGGLVVEAVDYLHNKLFKKSGE